MADFSAQALAASADIGSVAATPDGIAAQALLSVEEANDAPVVGNISPANGSTIEGTDPIFFDVTDDLAAFRRVVVYVQQTSAGEQVGSVEVAYDSSFMAPYALLSTRTNIANGWQFKLRRDGGWLGDVTVTIRAIDETGGEST